MSELSENSLETKFEQRLTREGMPAELHPLVTVPEFVSRALDQARQAAFEQTGDELPTIDDICREISETHPLLSQNKVLDLAHAVFASSTVENIEDIEDYNLAAHPDPTPDMALEALLRDDLERAISSLNNEAERAVVRQRYLEGKTLKDIGENLGYTRERARQIGDKALSRLRNPSRAHILEMYAEGRPWAPRINPEAHFNHLYEQAEKLGMQNAKHFIYLALRDLPSDQPAHVQRYTWGHRRVLERELKTHRETKDKYLLSASHFPDALAQYQHAANQVNHITEQIKNIRSGQLPTYTLEQVIEIELTNISHDIQATAIELARHEPGSGGAVELTKQQHNRIAYQKELLLAKRLRGNIRWDNNTGDWVSKYR